MQNVNEFKAFENCDKIELQGQEKNIWADGKIN